MPKKWDWCHAEGKRSFPPEIADKVLGRTQTSRRRKHRKVTGQESLRGIRIENRYYHCGHCDGVHLTSHSRNRKVAVA